MPAKSPAPTLFRIAPGQIVHATSDLLDSQRFLRDVDYLSHFAGKLGACLGMRRIELGLIDRIAKFGTRLIVSSDGSFRRPDSPRAEPVADRLRDLGLEVAGELYRRSDELQVEITVAWIDA